VCVSTSLQRATVEDVGRPLLFPPCDLTRTHGKKVVLVLWLRLERHLDIQNTDLVWACRVWLTIYDPEPQLI
jgi:hypothetical protein